MSDWRRVALGEVADVLVGYAYKSAEFTSSPEDVRLLRGVNIGQGFLDWDRVAFWPSDGRVDARYQLADGDVVLAMDRPWIEAGLKRARVRSNDLPALLVQRVARLRGTSQVRTSFLHHLLATDRFSAYLQGVVTGATVPHISQLQIEAFEMPLPSVAVQDGICQVLDAVDQLIENNRWRVELLEEMARAVYREWFVNFRYAGHEDATFVGSSLGAIPDGWAFRVSGDLMHEKVLDIGDGYRAKNAEMTGAGPGLPFVRVANVQRGRLALDRSDQLPESYRSRLRSKVSQVGDVVVSMKGTVGRHALVQDWDPAMAYSPQVSYWRSLRYDVLTPAYLYLWVQSDNFAWQCSAVKGATDMADYVNLTDQRRMHVLVPDALTMRCFTDIVQPLLLAVGKLSSQAVKLTALRDLLLPRLVAGRLDVSQLGVASLTPETLA